MFEKHNFRSEKSDVSRMSSIKNLVMVYSKRLTNQNEKSCEKSDMILGNRENNDYIYKINGIREIRKDKKLCTIITRTYIYTSNVIGITR